MKVLLVEDNPEHSDALTRLLHTDSCEVDGVQSGGAALLSLAAHNYDVVLLDLCLPDMRGMETFTTIRKATDAPIIILSGLDDKELAVETLKQGAHSFLLKPVSPSLLLDRMLHAVADVP